MKFFNHGTHVDHEVDEDTGKTKKVTKKLAPGGDHKDGTAVFSFRDIGSYKVGHEEWVEIEDKLFVPDANGVTRLTVETVKLAAPSLLTEEEAGKKGFIQEVKAAPVLAPAPKKEKGKEY